MKVLAFAVLLCSSAFCQQPPKIPVVFHCTCTDAVGALYATSFRDLLASSPRYRSTEDAETTVKLADGQEVHPMAWQVNVVSVDPTSSELGHASAISFVILIGYSFYVSHTVRWCPLQQVNTCAATSLADLDNTIQDYNSTHH